MNARLFNAALGVPRFDSYLRTFRHVPPRLTYYTAAPVPHAAYLQGEEDPPPASAAAVQAAQALATYENIRDPRVLVEVYKARIQNLQKMKRSTPLLAGIYDAQINVLRARIRALEPQAAAAAASTQATAEWRGLGQTGVKLGMVAGVALTVLLVAGAARLIRR